MNLDSGLAKDIKPNGFVYSYGWEFNSVDLTSDAKTLHWQKRPTLVFRDLDFTFGDGRIQHCKKIYVD